MTMTDYLSPDDVLFVGPGEGDQMIVIASDYHECGWQERIWYFTLDGDPIRSGCAGCEADRPITAIVAEAKAWRLECLDCKLTGPIREKPDLAAEDIRAHNNVVHGADVAPPQREKER